MGQIGHIVFGGIILWGLLFGVNINGQHYGISCGESGVNVQIPGR